MNSSERYLLDNATGELHEAFELLYDARQHYLAAGNKYSDMSDQIFAILLSLADLID